MKIRNGFVTNSSSSSFLISIDKSDYNNMQQYLNKKVKDLSFLEFAQMYIYEMVFNEVDMIITNEQELMDYLRDVYSYRDDIQILANQYSLQEYQKYSDLLKNSKVLFYIKSLYDSSRVYSLLYDIDESNNSMHIERHT